MDSSTVFIQIGAIVGAICTLAIFSVLFKENPYYRLFEHIFIGLAAGYGVFVTWRDVLYRLWWEPMINRGQWWWALAIAGGGMFYFIYSKKHQWISKLLFGALFGLGAGTFFQGFANTYFPMISASFKSVVPPMDVPLTDAIVASVNDLVFVLVLITVMAYFFFSIDHKAKAMRGTASLGRWFLMFAFGAMFGSTVMARMSLFIGRVDFLVSDVPRMFWPYAVGAAILIGLIYFFFVEKKRRLNQDAEPKTG